MAVRTTSTLVSAIIEVDSNISLTEFINIASILTDRVSTCATGKGITLTSTELEAIERYLAAHLYSLRDPLYKSKKTQDASASFQTGLDGAGGFGSTTYGRMAMSLDHSGCLREMNGQKIASVTWLGKRDTDINVSSL